MHKVKNLQWWLEHLFQIGIHHTEVSRLDPSEGQGFLVPRHPSCLAFYLFCLYQHLLPWNLDQVKQVYEAPMEFYRKIKIYVYFIQQYFFKESKVISPSLIF